MARHAPPTIRNGARWHNGTGDPAAGIGLDGDYYLNGTNGAVWTKGGGAWADTGTVLLGQQGAQGDPGADGAVWSAGALPGDGLGLDGDFHLTAAGQVYQKVVGAWADTTVNIQGPQGLQGIQGNPGVDGEFTSADLATAAQIRAAVANKLLDTASIYAAAAPVDLTFGATIPWDMNTGIMFDLLMTGNGDLENPTNVQVGKTGVLRVVQDATGSRTLGLPSNVTMAESGAIELSTAANAEDLFSWAAWSATKIYLFPGGKAFG